MAEIKPVHLLLLEPSSNDGEAMITTLRNHGYPVRATQVVTEDALQENLERQSWDLCLTRSDINGLTAQRAVEKIDEFGRDIPVILITEEDNAKELVTALHVGIKDAVPFSDQERLYLIAKRELINLEQRRLRKRAEAQLAETEKRCSLLLDSSQDAIAYIHDGMHIYANQAYVELFGFEDPDELLSMPVMDMISSKYHSDFKEFLRHYAKNPSNNSFACAGVKDDMSEFEAILTLSNATYDNEACTQVLIKTTVDSAELEAKLKELSAQDVLTGLYNQTYFQEKLDEIVTSISDSGQARHLFFLELDQYEEIEKEFSISGTEDMITEMANWLRNEFSDDSLIARYGNESFMIVVDESSPEAAKNRATKLCADTKEHLFEINGKTQKVTLSVGVTPVGDQANNAKELIDFAHSACQRARSKGGDDVKVFSKNIDNANSEHAEMIEQIHDAIESEKLHLLFQPIVKLHGEDKSLYQSLLRMSSEKGEVSPSEIFPIAEIGGLAAKLDRWVIMQSLKQLHSSKSNAALFVHLSSSALTDEGLIKFVKDIIESSNLPSGSLILTVNADDALTYLKRVILMSQALKKINVPMAISHVKNNPEHFSLLDQVLPNYAISSGEITTALSSGGDAISDITQICNESHSRDIATVAPKVEDAASLAALWPLGIGYIQGFYLQAPSPELDFDFSSAEF
ncbi:MAG: EAL domain-containing protein [Kangiellaceae bacterium]|jgi:diguanylate cyclase (GGDEF)-like protein/PAS domain S-box-containing protein|nr:EAL domain-containing protein [Kangiellaceae bacterium]